MERPDPRTDVVAKVDLAALPAGEVMPPLELDHAS